MKKVYGVWAVRSAASVFGAAQAWCKSDGRPLEFDTLREAEAYAKECNENISTSNVHYYAKEKEPEPNAAKTTSKQPDLSALSHAESTPRNDAAEKQNEITGRQMIAEQDAVEITGMSGGHIMGNLYAQDYRAVTKHLEQTAQNAVSVLIRFEGQKEAMRFSYMDYQADRLSIHAKFGKAETFRLEPEDPLRFKDILQSEKASRQKFITGDFEKHMNEITAGEKHSLSGYLKQTASIAHTASSKSKAKEQPER